MLHSEILTFALRLTRRKPMQHCAAIFIISMRQRLILFLSLICLFGACKKDEDNPHSSDISFDIGDIKAFEIPDSIYTNGFILSPVDSNGKIWTQTHELDLRTGVWTSLKKKFGVQFHVEVYEERMWIDPFSSNVYISCPFGNAIEYDRQSRTFKAFKLQSFSSFFAVKDLVLFGASEGLYQYVRGSGQPVRVKAFPVNTWVESINVSYGDTLRLGVRAENGDSYFAKHYLLDSYLGEPEKKHTSQTVYDLHVNELLPYLGNFKAVKDDSTIWFYDMTNLYIKKGKDVFQFTGLDSAYLRQLRVDSLYAYLWHDRRFVVLKKKYVTHNLRPFNAKSYQDQLQALIAFTSYDEPLSLDQTIFKVDSLQKIYLQSEHPRVVEYASSLNDLIGVVGLNALAKSELEHVIEKRSLPEKYLKPALNSLFAAYGYKDDLEKALHYMDIFDESFPNDQLPMKWMVSCISKAKTSRDSIARLAIPPDHKLFLVSLQREDLRRCAFAEVHSYDTVVSNSYRKILTMFPKSEFADNAAFYLLCREHHPGGESYGVSPEGIREIEAFIEKYNTSDVKIDAILLNIQMHLYYYVDGAERLVVLEKAQTMIGELSGNELVKIHERELDALKQNVAAEIRRYKNTVSR